MVGAGDLGEHFGGLGGSWGQVGILMYFRTTPGTPGNPVTLKVDGNNRSGGPNLLTTIAVWLLEISKQLNNRLATDTWRSEARKNDN